MELGEAHAKFTFRLMSSEIEGLNFHAESVLECLNFVELSLQQCFSRTCYVFNILHILMLNTDFNISVVYLPGSSSMWNLLDVGRFSKFFDLLWPVIVNAVYEIWSWWSHFIFKLDRRRSETAFSRC